MTQQQIFACLLSITLEAFAKPPVSPAGGGWLQLDESHDFVSTVKAWFPDKQFEGLTAEAWIYIEHHPAPETFWVIMGQKDRFKLLTLGGGGFGAWGRVEGNDPLVFNPAPVPINQWAHVVALYHAGAGEGLNGVGGNWCCPGGHLLKSGEPLLIGGIIPEEPEGVTRFVEESLKLRGYIDEVRISDVVRYVGPNWDMPKGRFQVDEHTISLWHFDEAPGASRFVDASGNGYDLWRGGVLAVQAQGKLATTWGAMKRP